MSLKLGQFDMGNSFAIFQWRLIPRRLVRRCEYFGWPLKIGNQDLTFQITKKCQCEAKTFCDPIPELKKVLALRATIPNLKIWGFRCVLSRLAAKWCFTGPPDNLEIKLCTV